MISSVESIKCDDTGTVNSHDSWWPPLRRISALKRISPPPDGPCKKETINYHFVIISQSIHKSQIRIKKSRASVQKVPSGEREVESFPYRSVRSVWSSNFLGLIPPHDKPIIYFEISFSAHSLTFDSKSQRQKCDTSVYIIFRIIYLFLSSSRVLRPRL